MLVRDPSYNQPQLAANQVSWLGACRCGKRVVPTWQAAWKWLPHSDGGDGLAVSDGRGGVLQGRRAPYPCAPAPSCCHSAVDFAPCGTAAAGYDWREYRPTTARWPMRPATNSWHALVRVRMLAESAHALRGSAAVAAYAGLPGGAAALVVLRLCVSGPQAADLLRVSQRQPEVIVAWRRCSQLPVHPAVLVQRSIGEQPRRNMRARRGRKQEYRAANVPQPFLQKARPLSAAPGPYRCAPPPIHARRQRRWAGCGDGRDMFAARFF